MAMNLNLDNYWCEKNLGKFGEIPDLETPYKFHIYSDLLDAETVSKLREDVKSAVKLDQKNNDLYKFKQSKDIFCETHDRCSTGIISQFIDALRGNIREHLEKSTGLKLSTKYFDITVSRYDIGDYLLCHNDDIKNEDKLHQRALAFIYYLNTRQWTSDDGGALIIYNSDTYGEPIEIANRIRPLPNTLVVFNTTTTSWHSVEEVYSRDDTRLSINGWFHTEQLISRGPIVVSSEASLHTIHRPLALDPKLERFFEDYVNKEYLTEKTCYLIRKKFKRQSEINLANFLVKEKYSEISQALKQAAKNDTHSRHVKLYTKRNYKRMVVDQLPEVCQDLYNAFRSELFFLFLWRVTGIELQPPGWKLEDTKMNDTSEDESESSDEEEECGLEDEEDEEDAEDAEDAEDDDDDHDHETDDEEKHGDDPEVGQSESPSGNENGKSHDRKAEKLDRNSSPKQDVQGCSNSRVIQAEISTNEQLDKPTADVNIFEKIGSHQGTKESRCKKQRVSGPFMRAEFRHLEHGSYTLIHDHDLESSEASGLDVILHFNHDFDVNFDNGGYISYIDVSHDEHENDSEQELLTMEPKSNSLSIVYRGDADTRRFLKYITKTHKSDYQDLSCVYYEKQEYLPYGGTGLTFDGHQSV